MAKEKRLKKSNDEIIKILETVGYKFRRNVVAMQNEVLTKFSDGTTEERVLNDGAWGEVVGRCRELAFNYGEEFENETVIKHAVNDALEKNKYNPIAKYLNDCMQIYRAELAKRNYQYSPIQEICDIITVNQEDTDAKNIFLSKWLVGCSGRVLSNFQNYTLIVGGRQGIGKSTFFASLCSGLGMKYFKTGVICPSNKDHVLALAGSFIWTADEFSSLLKTADRNLVKEFLTKDHIRERLPYAKAAESFDRNCSIAGTVNDTDFLTDATGNRRYIVIPDIQKIDIEQLQQINIDCLWGEVTCRWIRDGEDAAWLDEDEQKLQMKYNEASYVRDPLEEDLAKWLEPNPGGFIFGRDILEKVRSESGNSLSLKDRAWSMRIGDCMTRLGYDRGRCNGLRGFYGCSWVAAEAPGILTKRVAPVANPIEKGENLFTKHKRKYEYD